MRSHRALVYVTGTLALAALAGACTQDPDVVADVQAQTVDASIPDMPVAGDAQPMAMQCTLPPWVPGLYQLVENDNCTIKVPPELVAWIQDYAANAPPPPMGEMRAPMWCEAAGLQIYPDPDDETEYIICDATCKALRAEVAAQVARNVACMGALNSMQDAPQ